MALKWIILLLALLPFAATSSAQTQSTEQNSYVGFDRNDYPGDANLAALRKNFRYSSYWLSNPPGAGRNTWTGKRALLKQHGFGFLLLFNGRSYGELKNKDAAALGTADGKSAVAAALHEGFARDSLIFLDQEEGGRMLPEQSAYLFAWADAVRAAGARAGVYCSGIDVSDASGTISTARDILAREKARVAPNARNKNSPLKLWIANDQCPPSPGCTLQRPSMSKAVPAELVASTLVWQYAQSPRRNQFTGGCSKNYAADNRCYAPGMAQNSDTFVDLNVSSSPDPSSAQ
jgi:hypothetical protein